jgi:hypothetical protein
MERRGKGFAVQEGGTCWQLSHSPCLSIRTGAVNTLPPRHNHRMFPPALHTHPLPTTLLPCAAVVQVAFDPLDAGPNSQGPAVLYCTAGGRLCRSSLNSSSDAAAGLSSGEVLLEEPYGISSFDPGPMAGTRSSGLLVSLVGEQVCVVPREAEQQMGGW